MADIQLHIVLADLKERLLNTDAISDIPQAVHRRLTSSRRLHQAISEAVNDFVLNQKAMGIEGYIQNDLYALQDTGLSDYTALTVYGWPEPAFTERADGGVLHLVLDGQVFDVMVYREAPPSAREVMSLQQQASNGYLYGSAHRNAVADLFSNRIYVPENVTAKARIVVKPDPVTDDDTTVPISDIYQEWITAGAYAFLVGNVAGLGAEVKVEAEEEQTEVEG